MAESIEKKTVAKRALDVDDVLERLEARQLAAIEALRKLIDRLDDAMPNLVDDPALRKKVIDAIGDYYEQLVTSTNELIHNLMHGGSGMVPKLGDAKGLHKFLRSFAPSGARKTASQQDDAKPAANEAD